MAEELSRTQKYYWRNPEKFREYARKKRAANPEKHKEYTRKSREKYPDAERERHLKRKFNMTAADYDKMHEAQKGLCAICFQPETKSDKGRLYRLAVDHCHRTGKVRGLLCFKCNSAMGSFEKRDVPIINIELYLEKYRVEPTDTGEDCE